MAQIAERWSRRGVTATVGLFALLLGLGQILDISQPLQWAAIGGALGLVGTAAGGALSLSVQRIRPEVEDGMLGFAAGMMLAAAAFSLVLPGIELGAQAWSSSLTAALMVAIGLGLGAVAMTALDRMLPHEHAQLGRQGGADARMDRVWLFVMAMAIHNLPEGMAVGVGFAGQGLEGGWSLALAIAIQDVPEGLAVALALRAAGVSSPTAALIAAGSGVFEPLGAALGFVFASALGAAMPVAMGFAAGAMLFIVSHEVIPETHRRGHQAAATRGLMAGFALMMILDNAL